MKLTKAQFVAIALVVIAIIITTIAIGASVLLFGAYGCGKLVTKWLPFTPFEATIVSILSLMTSVWLASKLLARFFGSLHSSPGVERCAICGRYHDDDSNELADDDDEEAEEDDLTPNDGLRIALYATGAVKPNAPCPCGSGSRYSKCCGDGRLFRQRGNGSESRY